MTEEQSLLSALSIFIGLTLLYLAIPLMSVGIYSIVHGNTDYNYVVFFITLFLQFPLLRMLVEPIRDFNKYVNGVLYSAWSFGGIDWLFAKVIIVYILGATVFFYVSVPNKIVINENGHILGIENKYRAFLQGKKFWQNQLFNIEALLLIMEKESAQKVQREEQFLKIDNKFENLLEELCRKHPEFCPSPAEIAADRLRALADEIEYEAIKSEAMRKLRSLYGVIETEMDRRYNE
jgi:hypothetical protein